MSSTLQTFITNSVEETEQVGADVITTLKPGAVIALHGDLGAGKTQFARGCVRGLNGDSRRVSSPTYVLLHVYPTPTITIYHLDAYRVHGSDDFEAIGFTELLEQNAITIIEWPSRVASLLPQNTVQVTITTLSETSRQIVIQNPSA